MIGYDREELVKISKKQAFLFFVSMGVSAAACRQRPWKNQGFANMQQTQGGNSIEQLLRERSWDLTEVHGVAVPIYSF